MKKILLISLLMTPSISQASSEALDYCATVGSWAAQITIQKFVQQDKNLDPLGATSHLLVRTALKDKSGPIVMGEWGQLYTQTIKISLPFIGNKHPPLTIITSSIISAEECSLSEPSSIDMALSD